jgi:uracil-DNA glycosylase
MATTAAPLIPKSPSLERLRSAAATCTACDLWRLGTQTVFGSGPAPAPLMMVGEQPGDREDIEGHPFVGPAGRVLDRALAEAGIAREEVYVTNTVKHFRWAPRGKRRIHRKPTLAQVLACRPWLDAELAVVRPRVLVCLGATAAQAVLGSDFRLTEHRGEFIDAPMEPLVTATIHPSSILRLRDEDERHAETAAFVSDLRRAAGAVDRSGRGA